MNEDVATKIGSTLWSRSKQFRFADGPGGIAQEFLGYTVCRQPAGIPDDVRIAGMEVQDTVGADHLDRRIRADLPPAGQTWHKPAARKGVCRRHAKGLLVSIALDGGDCGGKRFNAARRNRPGGRLVVAIL